MCYFCFLPHKIRSIFDKWLDRFWCLSVCAKMCFYFYSHIFIASPVSFSASPVSPVQIAIDRRRCAVDLLFCLLLCAHLILCITTGIQNRVQPFIGNEWQRQQQKKKQFGCMYVHECFLPNKLIQNSAQNTVQRNNTHTHEQQQKKTNENQTIK